MAKWIVSGTVPVGVSVEVEADDEEGAKEAAHEEFSITGMCGNGRMHGALIGTNSRAVTLSADGGPEFDEVSPA